MKKKEEEKKRRKKKKKKKRKRKKKKKKKKEGRRKKEEGRRKKEKEKTANAVITHSKRPSCIRYWLDGVICDAGFSALFVCFALLCLSFWIFWMDGRRDG